MRGTHRGRQGAAQSQPDGPMSLRAYARSRGIPASTAAKALRDGRIDLLPDGKIDPEAADRAWVERTRLRVDSHVPDARHADHHQGPPKRWPLSTLNTARAVRESYRA